MFSLGSAGPQYLAVPVPWPAALALGSAGDTVAMLQTEALPYSVASLAGVLMGLLSRMVWPLDPPRPSIGGES